MGGATYHVVNSVLISTCTVFMEDLVPSGLELRESATYGRGLFSKRPLPPGTEFLTSHPFAYVVCSGKRGAVCDYCLRASESLLKCSQCKYIYYCAKGCQKRDWPLHKVECRSLVAIQPHSPTDTMRLVVRTMQRKKIKLKRDECESQGSVFAGREIDLLFSNNDSLCEEVREELALQLAGINKLMASEPDYVTEEAYNVLCRVICNTFYILDSSMNTAGFGLFLIPSLLNHSCDPSCVVVFNGRVLNLRTIRDVKSGEQLFISYTELLETKEKRQSHLNRFYSFVCTCGRCRREDERATGLLAAARVGVAEDAVENLVRDGLKRLSEDIGRMKKEGNWQGVVDCCKELLSSNASLLGPLNVLMVKLYQETFDAQLELEQWSDALGTAEQLLTPYQCHYPKYHPSLAVHVLKIAKIRRVLGTTEQLELSVKDLSHALDFLRVSHGADHPLTYEAYLLLQDSRGEIIHRESDRSQHRN